MSPKKTLPIAVALWLAGASFHAALAHPGDGPHGRMHGPPDPEKMTDRLMSKLDTNGDNLLTLDEFQSRPMRHVNHFERADKNRDGLLSLDEIKNARPGRRGPRPDDELDREAMRACIEEASGEGPAGPPDPQEMFTAADTNGDGFLDQQEAAAARDEHRAEKFHRLDVNGDSAVSRDELLAGLQARAERWRIFRACREEQLALSDAIDS